MNLKYYQRHTQPNQPRHDIAYEHLISALLDVDSCVFLSAVNRTNTSDQELAARMKFITFLSNISTGLFFTDNSLFSMLMIRIIDDIFRELRSNTASIENKHKTMYSIY